MSKRHQQKLTLILSRFFPSWLQITTFSTMQSFCYQNCLSFSVTWMLNFFIHLLTYSFNFHIKTWSEKKLKKIIITRKKRKEMGGDGYGCLKYFILPLNFIIFSHSHKKEPTTMTMIWIARFEGGAAVKTEWGVKIYRRKKMR